MPNQENDAQSFEALDLMEERSSRSFGTEIQLVASIDAAQATAVNWSRVNQTQCERIHMVTEELDELRDEMEDLIA